MADNATAGVAALSICESLLLSLRDRGVLDEDEIRGLLADVRTAHLNAADTGDEQELHNGVAEVVKLIIDGGNSIRSGRASD